MYDPYIHRLLGEALERLKAKELPDERNFVLRLSANFGWIAQLFEQLYPHQEVREQLLRELVRRLAKAYRKRPKRLRKRDLAREADPKWFLSQELVGMMLYVDRFCDTLDQFEEKLPYLEELGVNLVHFMPLLESPPEASDGGYAVSDFRKVQPGLGEMKDVRHIAKILHKRGMYLMLDLAVNHTSDQHTWARKARAGDEQYQSYFYMYPDRDIPDQYEAAMPQVFPDTAPGNFTYLPEIDQWVMTVFHDYQWDLNYTHPMVFLEMLDNLLFLANQGMDVVRLDALAFTWKRIGTDCQNLPEAHLLMQAFKACAQIVAPGLLFLAEAIVAPEEIVRYFGTGRQVSNECELAYNATLMTLLWDTVATKNNRLFRHAIPQMPERPASTSWLNYVRCHDDIGLGYDDKHAAWAGYDPGSHRRFLTDFLTDRISWSFAAGLPFMEDPKLGTARISGSLASLAGLEKALAKADDELVDLAIRRILMLHAFVMSWGGIPMLYMGDELAMLNDYSYLDEPDKAEDNRWVHRPRMDWAMADARHTEGSIQSKVFGSLSHLIALRKAIPAFAHTNEPQLLDTGNEHLIAFLRDGTSDQCLAIFNLNDHPESLHEALLHRSGFQPGIHPVDRISDGPLSIKDHLLHLESYQFCWIENPTS